MRNVYTALAAAALLAASEPLASVGIEERRKPKPGKHVPRPTFDGWPKREEYPSRQAWREACRQYERSLP